MNNFLDLEPFSLRAIEKEKKLLEALTSLTQSHYKKCEEYRRITDKMMCLPPVFAATEEIPFLPVSLFKIFELKSIPDEDVYKTMTSSGTSGQTVSKIFLDKATSINQQKSLVKIVSDFTGSSRMPMLIIDSASVIKNRAMFSARGAGILGFSIFGADRTYALDEQMNLDLSTIRSFLEKHQGKKILLFGFTFIVWQLFFKELKKQNIQIDLSNAILIHGGGWKKILHEAVSPKEFKASLHDATGIKHVHDYYGMVEQTGSIYMECDHGHLHASIYSDVIIRRPKDFSPANIKEKGLIQLISVLPTSYPGHSLLTEDEGEILGIDDCQCGRLGKYFKIHGRIKNAEIRGCSDTYEQR